VDYINLGRTGLKVSRICLGCMSYGDPTNTQSGSWVLGEAEGRTIIKQALDAGINFFDTANVYSFGASEEILGRAVKDFTTREKVVVATKVRGKMRDDPNGKGLSRKAIMNEIDASLRRLQTDYVDLYQIHSWDDDTPIEETAEALHDVVKAGKARYIGASKMPAWRFMKAIGIQRSNGWAQFVSMQNHYNLIYREEERETMPLCVSEGIGVIPFSPLARGKLARPWDSAATARTETDTWQKTYYGQTEAIDRKIVDRVADIAQKRGVARSQVALAWLLQVPALAAPIVGATKATQLAEAIGAVAVKLTADEVKALEELYMPRAAMSFASPSG
jgi:aryl-alcohol dehydrogenase-like predicted oxidoreductase